VARQDCGREARNGEKTGAPVGYVICKTISVNDQAPVTLGYKPKQLDQPVCHLSGRDSQQFKKLSEHAFPVNNGHDSRKEDHCGSES